MIGDLHCHTTLSDGSLGIEDIIVQAKRTGIDFISITDHDTMSSINRAKILGERYGVQTIPGVELSAWDKKRGRKKRWFLLFYIFYQHFHAGKKPVL